jgi:hypothetical protein
LQLTGTQKSFGFLNWGKLTKDGFFRNDYRSDGGVELEKRESGSFVFEFTARKVVNSPGIIRKDSFIS